jgi:hypothetical protein
VSRLEWVFTAKIVVTILFWAGPLLLLPAGLLATAGLPREAVPLARLLGCAYVALCVDTRLTCARCVRAVARRARLPLVSSATQVGAPT